MSATAVTARRAENRDSGSMLFRKALLILFLVAIYLQVPLYLTGSLFIPSVFTVVVLTPVLLLMYHRNIYRYEAVFVGQFLFVLTLAAVLSPGFIEYMEQKALGIVQFMAAIVGGVLLLKLLEGIHRRWLARLLLGLSVVLLAGAFLEVMGLLGGVSDAFREAVYSADSGYEVYDSDLRDLSILGFVRPSFFVSEPSLLAIGFLVFVNSWLLLSYSRRNVLLASLGALLMLALTGSPVLFLSLIATGAIMLFSESRLSPFLFIGLAVGLASLGVSYALPEIASNLTERLVSGYQGIGTLEISSENLRVVFPYITAFDVIQNSPVFGVGTSGKEVVERYSTLPLDLEYAIGNNVLAASLMYFGIVGFLLFVKVFRDYWRKLGIAQPLLLVVLILLLSQTVGGFEEPRFWGYVFLFTAVMKKRTEARKSRARSQVPNGMETRQANTLSTASWSRNHAPDY